MFLLLLGVLTAQADVVRATLAVDADGGLEVVRAVRLPGTVHTTPGELAVVDAEGTVLATGALPPLATHRAVVTPEGHDVARHRARYVQVELPWPEGSAELRIPGLPVLPASGVRPVPFDASTATRLFDAGPPDQRLDLVLLADGFTEGQESLFDAAAARIVTQLGITEPWASYDRLLNVWSVFTPSALPGIDQDEPREGSSGDLVTPFECHYGCGGLGRLVCCDEDLILDALDERAPWADGVLVLVNDDERYGGSGGEFYSTTYIGPDMEAVAVHELAHTLVLLWDEYGYGLEGDPEAFISPNCHPEGEPVPWSYWMDEDHPEIGAFEVCSFSNWVRPTQSQCMMNRLQPDYCAVCREHIVKRMYQRLGGGLITGADPAPGSGIALTDDADVTLTVETVRDAADLTFEWSLDGEIVGTGPSYVLDACESRGTKLTAVVRDDTEWVRYDPERLLETSVSWTLDPAPCGRTCGCASPPSGDRAPRGLAALVLLAALARRRREPWARS